MHLKVFLKLKKNPKTLSSGPKKPKKTQKTQKKTKKTKKPKKTHWAGFYFNPVFFQPCLEAQVVGDAVAWLAQTPPARAARLHTQNIVDFLRARHAIALLFAHVKHVGAVRQLVEEFLGLGRLVKDMLGRDSEDLDYFVHLIQFVGAAKQRLARVHFDQYAAERPHVNGQIVGDAEQHLGTAIEPALDVLVDPLPQLAAGAKVDDFNGAPLGIAEENVLRF